MFKPVGGMRPVNPGSNGSNNSHSNAHAGNIIMPPSASAGMRVVSMTMLETNQYNMQSYRPFETTLSRSTVAEFNAAYREFGITTPAGAIGSVAGNILSPSANARGDIPIVEGWDGKRLIFVLVVETQRFSGSIQRCVLTGFTDYVGATVNGAIDPNMRLYITNSVQMNLNLDNLGQSRIVVPVLSNASQVIFSNPFGSGRGFNDTYSMRPADVIGRMQTSHLQGETLDTRVNTSRYNSPLSLSNISNNNPSAYISNVVNGIRGAMTNPSHTSNDWIDILGDAKAAVLDTPFRKHMHLKPFAEETSLLEKKSFAYGELTNIDPYADNVVQVILLPSHQGAVFHGGNTEHWRGSNYESIIATRLAHALPSIMVGTFILACSLSISNESGRWLVAITDVPEGFVEGMPLNEYAQVLINRLVQEILPSLLPEGDNFVTITCSVNVVKDAIYHISYNFGPEYPYLNPTFANTLSTPNLTNDSMDLERLGSDIEQLCTDSGLSQHDYENEYITGNSHGYNF